MKKQKARLWQVIVKLFFFSFYVYFEQVTPCLLIGVFSRMGWILQDDSVWKNVYRDDTHSNRRIKMESIEAFFFNIILFSENNLNVYLDILAFCCLFYLL